MADYTSPARASEAHASVHKPSAPEMRLILRFALLQLFLVPLTNSHAQDIRNFESNDLVEVESLVGMSQSEIQREFGEPDELGRKESKEAVVWTYIVRSADEVGSASGILGYRQVAFWNGMVASISTKWITDEDHATMIYETSLEYMAEDNRTIARGANFDRDIFTDSLRISRRSDNIWMADMLRNKRTSHALLLVGDAGYHMCREAMELEAKRIETKFGVDVTQFSD